MKKGMIFIAALLAVIVILGAGYVKISNSLISLDEDVNTAGGQIDTQLQRRADLIPNVAETAKAYMKHEKEVFISIAEERAKLAGAKTREERVEAMNGLEGALSRLLVVVERYPELKANQTFKDLIIELEGSENRLAQARREYNLAVRDYNKAIRIFPNSIVASMKNLETKKMFEAEESASEAPKLDFGN